MKQKRLKVLMVEDDPGDVELTRETMASAKLDIDLEVVEDGEKALAYLHNKSSSAHQQLPDLILLDLNLPRKNGQEVLKAIKQHKYLRLIPVVILTSSSREEDIRKTYEIGCNCYVMKPAGLKQFTRTMHAIETFWFNTVKLPTCVS